MAVNQESYDKWKDGGTYRAAADILVAAAGGGTVTSLGVAVTRESLAWAADQMRQSMIEDSKKFPGICDTHGNCLDNKSGVSVGVNGDYFKLAGGRVDVEQLCGNNRCAINEVAGDWERDVQGRIKLNEVDKDGNTVDLPVLLAANPDWRSPLGGFQGAIGQFLGLGNYAPGSLQDILAEAYAGTHDTLNSKRWYGPDGNIRPGLTDSERQIGEVMNKINVLIATPFAIATLLPPDLLNIITTGIKK